MGTDEWFRNKSWDKQIETRFNEKLHRARRHNRSQYLRIQAWYLTHSAPDVALALLDQYFSLNTDVKAVDFSQALLQQADACLTQGRTEDALASLRKALDREREFPNAKTSAWSMFAGLVSRQRLRMHYVAALELLAELEPNQLVFQADRFNFHAAKALIYRDQGRSTEAQQEAREALAAASADHSGFQNHPKIGLVGDAGREIQDELLRMMDCAGEA